MRKDAFDGESGEIIHFDVQKDKLYRQQLWPITWSKAWTDLMTSLATLVFQPFCISTLEREKGKCWGEVLREESGLQGSSLLQYGSPHTQLFFRLW